MKTDEAKSLVEMIREASLADIIIVSFIILPIILGAWSLALNTMTALEQQPNTKMLIPGVLVFIYIMGVYIMKVAESKQAKINRAKKHIRNLLLRRSKPIASFEYIRLQVNKDYTDRFILNIIETFPDEFRHQGIKGGKAGIALVGLDEEAG